MAGGANSHWLESGTARAVHRVVVPTLNRADAVPRGSVPHGPESIAGSETRHVVAQLAPRVEWRLLREELPLCIGEYLSNHVTEISTPALHVGRTIVVHPDIGTGTP